MPKMIYICILLIYFKVISKKGGHYCPRLPYIVRVRVTISMIGMVSMGFTALSKESNSTTTSLQC